MAYAQQDNFMGPGDFLKHGRKTEATLATVKTGNKRKPAIYIF